MREIAAGVVATKRRILKRLAAARPEEAATILEDELRGLYHGLFVVLDGGSALADEGLVHVVDEDGNRFDTHLHEVCFGYWPRQD